MSIDLNSIAFESYSKDKETKLSSLDCTMTSTSSKRTKNVSFIKTEFVKVISYKKYNKIYKKQKPIFEEEEEGLCKCQCIVF